MFEKPTTARQEKVHFPEKATKDQYNEILEEMYRYGGSLDLPELEVFGVGEVDMKAISEFSLALVDFLEKKEQEADEEELERLYHFGQNIHSEFFSASPSLINYIRLPDRLKLMTRATRSKVVQGTFGSVFVGETVYDVSFMKGRLDEITIKAMEALSVPEKLDLLYQLRTVGAQAIAGGEWSRPAYNQVRQTYETLMNSEDSAVFVQLAAEAGLEVLDAEYENPQLSFIRREGQTTDSRLNTRFSNEQVEILTAKFFSKYSLDHVVSNSTRVIPATKDALVCMDKSGLAAGIIKIDVATFLSSPKSELDFDVNQYRIYKQHLDVAEQSPASRRDEISVKIYHAIYDEYVGELVTNGNAEEAAKVFSEILPILSLEEWHTYFLGEVRQQEFPSQNALYQEAGDENSKASEKYVAGLFKYREQLGERYEDDYLELEAALEHDDFEYAFEIASKITLKCHYEKESTSIHQEVAGLQEKVRDTHQTNFAKAKEKFEAARVALGQTEEIQARAGVVKKIDDNLDELGEELRTYIERKLASTDTLPQLELTTLKELIAELKGDDSLERVTDEDVLLFQHVHSGELASKIEREFDFSLSSLSLKEQYFFLNYLKRVTPISADTIKRFTSLYGVDGMRTFLSLEQGDETLGDSIVAFGQHDDVAGTVFRYYSDLLNSADRAETLVREVSGCEGETCIVLANQVRENILKRAQKDLEKAVRSSDPAIAAAEIENYVAEAKEYVALLQEVGAGKIESVLPESLSDEDRSRMQNLLQANYRKAYPEPENDAFKAAVAGSLAKSFSNPHTTFRILRDNGKIVSYNRFDTLRDYTGKEVSYFGSFNADPAYSGVGGIMLEETIKDQLENGRPMMAHCDPTQAITKKYIEDGFVATGFYPLAGKPSFEIWRSKDSTEQLESKEKTIQELLSLVEESKSIVVREQSESETYPELQKSMGLTRYFTHQGKTYLVFETLPNTLQDEFTPPQEDLKKVA